MASLVPGFEYDVFISYRHNDNLDGWVTTFVHNLEKELKATLKDPVSIYFDKSPHDGLLELHHVEKSLEGKLKCLILIPILSQTYSDPVSFAWQHEFCAFNRKATDDVWTRDVRLPNGNVACRILPVKIHELDDSDRRRIEEELKSPLRAIDFTYKEPGVNRPLKEEDSRTDNQNHTEYRNQINKVANAVKEILHGIKEYQAPSAVNPVSTPAIVEAASTKEPSKSRRAIGIVAVMALALVATIWWSLTGKSIKPSITDKSLVVLPFDDLSPKRDQKWFSDGVTEELLNQLAGIPELRLISRTTSFILKEKDLSAKRIADTLNVAHILEGSVQKVNDKIKITVQLIRASDDSHIWSHAYDYKIDSIFKIEEDISRNVAQTLNLLLDPSTKDKMTRIGTDNIDAYLQFLKGQQIYNQAHAQGGLENLFVANRYFENAIKLDPHFAEAYYYHSDVYSHNLLGGENIDSLKSLTERERYSRMMSDVGNAVKYAKSREKQLGYGFGAAYLSQDWSQLPGYMNENEQWSSGWEMVLTLRDPKFVYQRYKKALERNPLGVLTRGFVALTLMNMKKYDSALLLYSKVVPDHDLSSRVRSHIYLRKGDYDKGLEILKTTGLDSGYTYLLLRYLNNEWMGTNAALKHLIRSQPADMNSVGETPIQLFNAMGAQESADSLAQVIDSRMMGPVGLANNVLFFGLHFHLKAAPNFTKRLIELGVDPQKFEQENFMVLKKKKMMSREN